MFQDKYPEDRYVDYKQKLPEKKSTDNLDENSYCSFIKDICSFANSLGGIIIYGIKEGKGKDKGKPEEVEGLGEISEDAEKRRLQNIIHSRTDPTVKGLELKKLTLKDGKAIFIIKVPKKTCPLHINKIDHVIWERGDGCNQPMDAKGVELTIISTLNPLENDVYLLRTNSHDQTKNLVETPYSPTQNFCEKANQFRIDRISKITQGETPIEINLGSKIVLHFMPEQAFDTSKEANIILNFDFNKDDRGHFQSLKNVYQIAENASTGANPTYNFEGYLIHDGFRATDSYLQVFSNGILEAVDSHILKSFNQHIPGQKLYQYIRWFFDYNLKQLKGLGVGLPLCIGLSFLGISSPVLQEIPEYVSPIPIKRQYNQLLSSSVVESYESYSNAIEMLLDPIWRDAGFQKFTKFWLAGRS